MCVGKEGMEKVIIQEKVAGEKRFIVEVKNITNHLQVAEITVKGQDACCYITSDIP